MKHVQDHVQRISANERDGFTEMAGEFNKFQRQRQQVEHHEGRALGSRKGDGRDRTTASRTALKLPDVNRLGDSAPVKQNVRRLAGAASKGPPSRGPSGTATGDTNRRLLGDASR